MSPLTNRPDSPPLAPPPAAQSPLAPPLPPPLPPPLAPPLPRTDAPPTVVITGAAAGQGLAEARLAAASGWTVIACDVAQDPSPELDEALFPEELAPHRYLQVDVTQADDWLKVAAAVEQTGGVLNGLVNNAGITRRKRLLEATLTDLQEVSDVNLGGALLGIQTCVPLMPPGASIVNVGSVAALTAHYPVAYTASKWALRGLTLTASMELGPRGIRVNAVHPGFIETPMTASAAPAFRTATLSQTPLGRTGRAEEVAGVVLFLLSPAASYVSGAEIPVDGGQSAHGGAMGISLAMK